MGCLHPGWSWLSSLLPVGPVYSYLCQGGEDCYPGERAKEQGQADGENGSASTQAEEQREEKPKHWSRFFRHCRTLLFRPGGSCQRDQAVWSVKVYILFIESQICGLFLLNLMTSQIEPSPNVALFSSGIRYAHIHFLHHQSSATDLTHYIALEY